MIAKWGMYVDPAVSLHMELRNVHIVQEGTYARSTGVYTEYGIVHV